MKQEILIVRLEAYDFSRGRFTFQYFIDNYPHLTVNSLQTFINNRYSCREEIRQEGKKIREEKASKRLINALKFIFDKLPEDTAYGLFHEIVPYQKFSLLYSEEEMEFEFWAIKPQLKEVLSYFEELSQTECLPDNDSSPCKEQYAFNW